MEKIENKIHRVTREEMKEIEKELAKMDYLKICRMNGEELKYDFDAYDKMADSFGFERTWDVHYFLDYMNDLYDELNPAKQGFAIIIDNYSKSMVRGIFKKKVREYDRKDLEKVFDILCHNYQETCIDYDYNSIVVFFNVYLVD